MAQEMKKFSYFHANLNAMFGSGLIMAHNRHKPPLL